MKRPSDAKAFPEKSVGDLVYYCSDLEEGVETRVIVAFDSEGYPITTSAPGQPKRKRQFADTFFFASAEEALEDNARSELEYHRRRLDHAEACVRALNTGSDLTKFLKGAAK